MIDKFLKIHPRLLSFIHGGLQIPNRDTQKISCLSTYSANSFLLTFFLCLCSILGNAGDIKKQIIEAEKTKTAGGASKVSDNSSSGKSLANAGQAVTFVNLPAANKPAIRYASINVGTISLTINNQKAIKVNVHSSGASTGSFLYAIIEAKISNSSTLTVSLDTSDVALNIDGIDPAPIKLQAHGDLSEPISYRNIWLREL